ncbi:MAG: glycosyltransferase [Anaerolineae bacterium]|nr:glycosyltransferase [Anaerolineae bacterium]
MPPITILTPSYNQAQYIRATIDSVLSQDYADFEYLVIDGGSTDGTVDILKSYSDPRMTWVSERDKGQADALNKGLRLTSGAVLTWINSDDTLLPGAVRFMVDYFAQHPQVDMLYGDANLIDSAGASLGLSASDVLTREVAVTGDFTLMQQGSAWRRRASETLGGFRDDLHYVFDAEYWVRMLLAGFRVEYVPGVRAEFRMHDASKTISQRRRFVDDWRQVIDRLYADPALPEALRRLRPAAQEFLDWQYAKIDYAARDYAAARPALQRVLRAGRPTRRVMAAVMLTDVYLGTSFAPLAAAAFRRLTGRNIEGVTPTLPGTGG